MFKHFSTAAVIGRAVKDTNECKMRCHAKFHPNKVEIGRLQLLFSTCRDDAAHISTDASPEPKVLMLLKSCTSQVVDGMGGRKLGFCQEKDVMFADLEEVMNRIKVCR